MKFTKNQFIWLVVLFFSCFLIYTYWETVVSICNKIFVAKAKSRETGRLILVIKPNGINLISIFS